MVVRLEVLYHGGDVVHLGGGFVLRWWIVGDDKVSSVVQRKWGERLSLVRWSVVGWW